MDNANTIPQGDAENTDTVKTNIVFPSSVWKETKKAAIDKGVSTQQFVVDIVATYLGLKDAA